jgi:hypothetical protein
MDVCGVRLVRDLRGLYRSVWREMCLESSNYLLFFLKRIVFVFILMSLLKIEEDGGLVLPMYLGGSQLASGPGFGGEVLTPPSYTKS